MAGGACAVPGRAKTARTSKPFRSERMCMTEASYASRLCERIGPMRRTLAALIGLLAFAASAAAQIPERLDRALTAIYARNEYRPEGFRPAVWIHNGSPHLTIHEPGPTPHDTPAGPPTLPDTPPEP